MDASRPGDPGGRWWRLGAWLVVLAWALGACSGEPVATASGYQSCRASCSQPGADGESCLTWSSSASATCVARYSTVGSCCNAGGQAICVATSARGSGAPCVCRGADRTGTFGVQGSACKAS